MDFLYEWTQAETASCEAQLPAGVKATALTEDRTRNACTNLEVCLVSVACLARR
jgi:hypothetical protein